MFFWGKKFWRKVLGDSSGFFGYFLNAWTPVGIKLGSVKYSHTYLLDASTVQNKLVLWASFFTEV